MPRGALALRLALTFAAVAAMTVVLAAALITGIWDRQFEDYVRENVQARADDAAFVFAQVYEDAGDWEAVRYVDLGHFGVAMRGFRIQLYDEEEVLVGDTMASVGLPPNSPLTGEDDSPVAVAPIMVDGRQAGEVRVTTLNPGGYLSDRDTEFRTGSLVGLMIAAVIAVVAASVAGALFARTLVRPIEQVTAVADRLRGGDLEARTGMTGAGSIEELGRTLDSMAEAIEAEREFERRLTADVAHELRTPLQAIQATVEAMQDGVLPADCERLGTVREETMRLARLADGILELSRLESGAQQMRCEPLDPARPVRTAIDAHRALIESSGLTLSSDLAEGLSVMGDADRLTQAVGNLLSNAARYTPEGGEVRVRLRVEDAQAVVSVRDSGIGISEEDREKVFTRFWRADPARARAKGGAGIGLAVVKEVVERHGGSVSVDSGDWGTEFALRVPLAM